MAEIVYRTIPSTKTSIRSNPMRNSLSVKGLVWVAIITTKNANMVRRNKGLKILARMGAKFSTMLFLASTR